MFDINTIINDAIAAAVAQAIQPLQQEYANKMAEMAEKIATLTDRVAMLESQALVVSNAVDTRITASNAVVDRLHERVATREGALTDRIAALEMRLTLSEKLIPAQGVDTTLEQRIAALEKHTAVLDEHGGLLEYLDNQEWFWGKIRNFTDGAVEQAMDMHIETYDHDDFVTGDKLDGYVKTDNFRDEIEDVINNATIRLNF